MKPSCVEWQLCTIYWMAAVKQRKEKVRVKKEKWKLTKKVRVEEEKRKLTKEVGHNLIFCLIDWLTLDLTRLYYISEHPEYLLAWFLCFIFSFSLYENLTLSTEIYLTSRVYLSSEWIIFLLFFLCDCISLWRESWPFFMTFLYALSPYLGPNFKTWPFSQF